MKKRVLRLVLSLTTLGTILGSNVHSQITTGGDAFLKGKYVEVGICPMGAYGSVGNVPSGGGYHPRPGGFGSTLGFVADPDMDGWTTGSPAYIGDYFLPGSPQEGWDIQIDGDRMGGWRGTTTTTTSSVPGAAPADLPGSNTEYDTLGPKIYAVWSGTATDYDLDIRITTSLDTNKVYFIGQVVLKNNGPVDLHNIYFNRTVDPDNEAAMVGCYDYTTENVIVYQPDSTDLKCLVSARGRCYDSYLGLGAKDCRAKSYIIVGDGLMPNQPLDEIYNGETDYLIGDGGQGGGADTLEQDTGVGLVFNVGTIEAGDSTILSYAYILREADLDSAFAELGATFALDGSVMQTGDTTVHCVGYEMEVVINGADDFTWEEWTPATGLAVTSGASNIITVGSDTITYRITGISALCNQRDTLFLTVTPIIIPPQGVDSFGYICANSSPVSLFDYIGGDPPTTGTWSGLGATAAGIFTPSAAGIGSHDLIYAVYVDGCLAVNKVTMHVYNYVDIDFDWDLNKGCLNDTVIFENKSELGSYRWNFGDASPFDTSINPSHIYESQGEYAVWLVVQNLEGCIDSVQKLVNTQHPLIANFTMDFDSICQNGIINFMDNSTGSIQRWDWDFGDGTTSTIQSPSHHYSLAGYHTVRLVVTDDVPCTDTFYQNVYIDSLPSLEILTDKPEVCNGERINMSLEYLYTANGFTWDFGDGTMLADGSSSTFHSYDAPGEYYIEVRSHHPNCRDAIAYDTIKVKPYPVVNLGPDTTLCLNGAPLFLSSEGAVPAGTQWQWSTGDTTAVLKVVHPGTYVAQAIFDGCTGSDEITVTKDCYTDIPNSFTPDGDGVNDYFLPRQLISKGVIGFNMTIFDRWGQKVFETNSIDGRGWDGKMNEKDMPVGVYVYMINVVYKNNTSEKYTGNVTLLR
jgi:gliding motility-associated-like protein